MADAPTEEELAEARERVDAKAEKLSKLARSGAEELAAAERERRVKLLEAENKRLDAEIEAMTPNPLPEPPAAPANAKAADKKDDK